MTRCDLLRSGTFISAHNYHLELNSVVFIIECHTELLILFAQYSLPIQVYLIPETGIQEQ